MNLQQNTVLLAEIGILERQVYEKERLLMSLPHKADSAKLKAAQLNASYENTSQLLATLSEKKKNEEQELALERTNLRKWEKRADEIQGERSYSSLMSEISAKKKHISEAEDSVLQLMQDVETHERELVELKSSAEVCSKIASDEWNAVKAQIADVEVSLQVLKSSLQEHLSQLHPSLKTRYERVSAGRQGVAIAFLEKEVCLSCRQMVPPELFLRVLKGEVIEQCPSCKRILVAKQPPIDVIGIA